MGCKLKIFEIGVESYSMGYSEFALNFAAYMMSRVL